MSLVLEAGREPARSYESPDRESNPHIAGKPLYQSKIGNIHNKFQLWSPSNMQGLLVHRCDPRYGMQTRPRPTASTPETRTAKV